MLSPAGEDRPGLAGVLPRRRRFVPALAAVVTSRTTRALLHARIMPGIVFECALYSRERDEMFEPWTGLIMGSTVSTVTTWLPRQPFAFA